MSLFKRNIKDLMDHIIDEGNCIYKDTNREHTWLIYHDHLKIWWEKESQEYLKSLPCPIEGNPSRTWYDRLIKICGEENNAKVAKRYQNCLPGDSPELMPLDCHLFADLKEGSTKNVALTNHIREGDPNADLKYSFSMPLNVFSSLQRTLEARCPSTSHIAQDINRVFDETLTRIAEARGTYIEDSSTRQVRHGVRGEAASIAAKKKRETLPVDKAALDSFNGMVHRMRDGGGVSFAFDLMQLPQQDEVVSPSTLESVEVDDEEDGVEDEE
jgi:hypothetical protein